MNKKKIWTGLLLMLLCTLAMGMSVSAADKTMKNKKWVSGKGGAYIDEDKDGRKEEFKFYDTQYYKIKIPKQGYIMVDVTLSSLPGKQEYIDYYKEEYDDDGEFAEFTEEGMDIGVLNAKKKELLSFNTDDVGSKNNKKFSWAVKKGTYYLSAKGNAGYKLRYTFTPVAKVSKAGKSFAKAVTLKKGTMVKNLLFCDGTLPEHYYKLKLSKKSKVTLVCNSKITGDGDSDILVQMYVKKGKNYRVVNAKGKVLTGKWSTFGYDIEGKRTVSYTLPKGTYYLRVAAIGSGYYTMKWK